MKPSDQLQQEHEGITLMLEVLEAIGTRLQAGEAVPTRDLEDLIEFFQVFADKCHHSKEEDILFPAYQAAGVAREGGPLGVMLAEHQEGREYLGAMKAAISLIQDGDIPAKKRFLNASQGYIRLLTDHIAKENHCLFPMGDQNLSDAEQQRILAEFDHLENTRIGAGKHEAFHRMMERFAETYLGTGAMTCHHA